MTHERMIRLLQLIDELTHLEWIPLDQLCTDFSVDPRTLTRDIMLLREMGLAVERRDNQVHLPVSALSTLRRVMLESTIPGWPMPVL